MVTGAPKAAQVFCHILEKSDHKSQNRQEA